MFTMNPKNTVGRPRNSDHGSARNRPYTRLPQSIERGTPYWNICKYTKYQYKANTRQLVVIWRI